MCADPAILGGAFNEVLRYDAPVQVFGRVTTKDTTFDGVAVPAGAQQLMLYGSGNRDERHYPDSDCFDASRNPAGHLRFGYGTHGCAGQALAKIEAHAVLRALASRVRRFEVGEPVRHLNNTVRGLSSLPVLAVERHQQNPVRP